MTMEEYMIGIQAWQRMTWQQRAKYQAMLMHRAVDNDYYAMCEYLHSVDWEQCTDKARKKPKKIKEKTSDSIDDYIPRPTLPDRIDMDLFGL